MSPDEPIPPKCPQCGTSVTGLEQACPKCGKKFDKSVKFECPFCGELVFPGANSCPGCHIDFRKIDIGRFAQMLKPAQEKTVDDAINELLGELHQFTQTETKAKAKQLICLNCAASLDGSQEKCPNCRADLTRARSVGCPKCRAWVTLDDEFCPDCHNDLTAGRAESFAPKTRELKQTAPVMEIGRPKTGEPQAQCSSCGNLVGLKETACPFCGVQFEGVEHGAPKPTPPKASPIPSIDERVGLREKTRKLKSVDKKTHIATPAPTRSQISKRGLSNGVGETNGLSFVNGKRSPDGKSFVNGTGVSNGLRLSRKAANSKAIERMMRNWKFLTILIAIAIVIPTFIYVSYSRGGSPYSIDGKFTDWKDSTKLGARTPSSIQSINLQEWSVEIHDLDLYLYVKTQSSLMKGQNVESLFLYVDSDSSASTGYRIDQMGADYLLETDGWNGSVQSTALSTYGSVVDQLDWNSWQSVGGLAVSFFNNQLEAMASLPKALPATALFLLVTQDDQQRCSSSYDVPAEGGLLIVQQVVPVNVSATGVIPQTAGTVLLSLVFTCQGAGGSVQSVSPELSGVAEIGSISSFPIEPAGRQVVDVRVDATSAQAGQLATAFVKASDVASSFSEVQVIGDGARAYVKTPPKMIVIDGAFGDWANRTVQHNDSTPVSNPNVKISDVGAANDSAGAYFYVSVEGQMCSGTYVPAIRVKPSGAQGGGVFTPQRKTAEDVMKVFIDIDRSSSTGMQVALDSGSSVIGADQLIEIRGLFGKITSTAQLGYVSGDWVAQTSTVEAAIDNHQMEISIGSTSLGPSTLVDFIIQTTSWKGPEDSATCTVVPDPWTITTGGVDSRSPGNGAWYDGSSISLVSGDTVVDMDISDGQWVYAVTNSGRVHQWQMGTSTSWSSNVTDTVNGTANIVGIAAYKSGSQNDAYILASDGRLWTIAKLGGTGKAWTYKDKVWGGIADFVDLDIRASNGNLYAIRSAANSLAYWAQLPNLATWHITSSTGSTSPQTHVVHIFDKSQANERILILCENGNIRNSANGGNSWNGIGNLPVPTGGNATTSKYVGMEFDGAGYLWVITASGWSYVSTDATTLNTFISMGRATTQSGVTAITCPIPELHGVYVIVLFQIGIIAIFSCRRRRGPAR